MGHGEEFIVVRFASPHQLCANDLYDGRKFIVMEKRDSEPPIPSDEDNLANVVWRSIIQQHNRFVGSDHLPKTEDKSVQTQKLIVLTNDYIPNLELVHSLRCRGFGITFCYGTFTRINLEATTNWIYQEDPKNRNLLQKNFPKKKFDTFYYIISWVYDHAVIPRITLSDLIGCEWPARQQNETALKDDTKAAKRSHNGNIKALGRQRPSPIPPLLPNILETDPRFSSPINIPSWSPVTLACPQVQAATPATDSVLHVFIDALKRCKRERERSGLRLPGIAARFELDNVAKMRQIGIPKLAAALAFVQSAIELEKRFSLRSIQPPKPSPVLHPIIGGSSEPIRTVNHAIHQQSAPIPPKLHSCDCDKNYHQTQPSKSMTGLTKIEIVHVD